MGRRAARAADLAALVGKAYESALAPLPFSGFLPDMTAALDADGAVIALYAPELGLGALPASYRVSDSAQRRYNEHFWKIDPWRIEHARRRIAGAVTGATLMPFRELAKTEIYNDHLRDAGFFDTCCAEIHRSGSAGAAISILRAHGRPFFGRSEVARLNRVLPHLEHAFALHRRFAGLIAERTALASIIDRLHGGAILCDETGRVVYASDEARRILDRGAVLFIARGRLRARDADTEATFGDLYDTGNGRRRDAAASRALIAKDGDGRAALRLSLIRAVPRTILDARGTGLAYFVLIEDLAVPRGHGVERIAERHRLTAAETRLAHRLAAGATLADAADALGVSVNTVRSQLRQIFQKTGVSRQAELVRLVLTQT